MSAELEIARQWVAKAGNDLLNADDGVRTGLATYADSAWG
jgi:hypothetical protein